MTAFLFPGQGSQKVGMGADLYDAFPEAKAIFDEANAVLGFDLTAIMFGVGMETEAAAAQLKQTEITQPALFVHSMAALAVLTARGLVPAMTAGHSLGEYSALVAAGAFSFADGLRTVRRRGELMAQAGAGRPGAMAAVLNLDAAVIEQVCTDASTATEVVQPANYNSPDQVVISGDAAAVERAMEALKAAGARRVLPLPVSGAFHSPLMEEPQAHFAETLATLPIQTPRCPVYLNVTAEPTTDPEAIRSALLAQLTGAVRWTQTLQAQHADGATRFLEVGTGNVLTGLVRRTLGKDVDARTFGTTAELDTALAA